jgi:hypothetical protein
MLKKDAYGEREKIDDDVDMQGSKIFPAIRQSFIK